MRYCIILFDFYFRNYSNLDRAASGHLVFWLLTCFQQTVHEVVPLGCAHIHADLYILISLDDLLQHAVSICQENRSGPGCCSSWNCWGPELWPIGQSPWLPCCLWDVNWIFKWFNGYVSPGVAVYYDKINSSVIFTYFGQYVSNPLVIYVIEYMMFWSVTMVMVFPIKCKFSF